MNGTCVDVVSTIEQSQQFSQLRLLRWSIPWRKSWTIVRQAIPFRRLGFASRTHTTVFRYANVHTRNTYTDNFAFF